MNSAQRHEARYQRRKKKREEKRQLRSKMCGGLEEVFSYEHLYQAGKKCIKGVIWKTSIQNYKKTIFSNTYKLYKQIQDKKFKFSKPLVFMINERGKERKIQAQKIQERVLQRALCDNVIVPIYDKTFIYDNAANRIGKGINHTMNRVNCHMQRHFRKYGLNGYIVSCDIRDFFNSAPHNVVYQGNQKRIHNEDIRNIANMCMEVYGSVGFGLGAHTSQIYTNIVLTPLDHYIKDKLKVKCYGRYVDDFYFFTKDLQEAKSILSKVGDKVKELGLELNENKTRIQKFSTGFRFLKTKFYCTPTGKILRKINKKSPVRMRKKIKKFSKWIKENRFTKEQAINAYQSWRGHAMRTNCYFVMKNIDKFVLENL